MSSQNPIASPLGRFLAWLVEWNVHSRQAQRLMVAAVVASLYTHLESENKHPRSEIVRLIDSGLLADQMAELLHYAVGQLDRLELEFEERHRRLPTALELLELARLSAEAEVRRELDAWDLPF